MPGPKSPFGYDKIFHDILGRILLPTQPTILRIKTPYKPTRARALYNQFKESWLREAEQFRKRKDHERASSFLRSYYALQNYSCTLSEDGIVLTNRQNPGDYTIEEQGETTPPDTSFLTTVTQPTTRSARQPQGKYQHKNPLEALKLPTDEEVKQSFKDQAEIINRIYRTKTVDNPAPIIDDNPGNNLPVDETPQVANKYGLPMDIPEPNHKPGTYASHESMDDLDDKDKLKDWKGDLNE